jgi:hypothetical protein
VFILIKIKQPTLKNFSIFQHIGLFEQNVRITKNGIVHVFRENCPICGTKCQYNGSSNNGRHIFSKSYDVFLRKGQQYCSNCKKTIQVENNWLNDIIQTFNDYIISQIISLSNSLSEDEIVKHLKTTMSIKISKSQIHSIITTSNEELASLELDYTIEDNFYGYDEQYIMINGKRAYRLVFYDLKNDKIIYEETHYKFSKKILQNILKEVFGNNLPKGFVVDMRLEYPDAFKSVFGKKIKIQYCIFHLNKLILKEYADSLRINTKINWTITDYYNLYTLFNIFYDRTFELNLLNKFSKHFENFKIGLNNKKIENYLKKYNINVKKVEIQRKKIIEIIQKKILKAFRKILHSQKNKRKRDKTTLKVRTIESAKKEFEKIFNQINLYPIKIQKRIQRIKENFEYFIGSNGEVLTNNKLEGFFGATLKKFRKKIKRSILSFKAMLNRKRIEKEGKMIYRKFGLFDLTKIFIVLSFFE